MSGLLLEGIIKFHKLTGDDNAAMSIFMALDYLMENCLASTGKHAGKSFCTSVAQSVQMGFPIWITSFPIHMPMATNSVTTTGRII
jgi:hypothetical protein